MSSRKREKWGISMGKHMVKAKKARSSPVRMSHSIRIKLILIMFLMMGLVLFGLSFMNYAFLSSYYEYSKAALLAESYYDVNTVVGKDEEYNGDEEELSSAGQLKLEQIRENTAVNLYIFQLANFWGDIMYRVDYPDVTEVQKKLIEDLTEQYIYREENTDNIKTDRGEKKLIREKENYTIFKVYDERIGSHYLELFGKLDVGSFIYLRTNYQSMNENIAIFNRFIAYTGCGILLVGGVLMIFVGNSVAKPIVQITDIAQRMSELDFEVKYPVTSHDEIGVLGSCINMLSETLETTISELKMANNELQKDIEHKIQIDEMRKDFLSNVSHELKTPIALIQGYAEGLQDNINEDKESRDFYCEVIIDEAKKMNKMVKKLLTLNQIEFGNNQVNFDHFDIVSLIQNVVNSASLLAEQKEASMGFDKEYEPIYVWADEYMVEEIVTNYISNAINHVDFEKKIVVSLEQKGEVVRIKVFNNGRQIPEEELDKVWIKFYKVDKARTREYGGRGIGLSIVKAITDSMNRECGVLNHPDGVEFWFELDSATIH